MRLLKSIMFVAVATLILALMSACASSDTAASAQPGGISKHSADAIAVTNLRGTHVRPFASVDPGGASAAVFIFITTDCPICNASAPEIQRIAAEYGHRGVAFWFVHTDPDLAREAAIAHTREYGYDNAQGVVLLDPEHKLVTKLGAKVTPEAFVVTKAGTVYRGRIDDLFPERGKKREAATTRELRDAIDDVLARRAVRVPESKAIGCYIAPLPGR